jgi:hypothetical protein
MVINSIKSLLEDLMNEGGRKKISIRHVSQGHNRKRTFRRNQENI